MGIGLWMFMVIGHISDWLNCIISLRCILCWLYRYGSGLRKSLMCLLSWKQLSLATERLLIRFRLWSHHDSHQLLKLFFMDWHQPKKYQIPIPIVGEHKPPLSTYRGFEVSLEAEEAKKRLRCWRDALADNLRHKGFSRATEPSMWGWSRRGFHWKRRTKGQEEAGISWHPGSVHMKLCHWRVCSSMSWTPLLSTVGLSIDQPPFKCVRTCTQDHSSKHCHYLIFLRDLRASKSVLWFIKIPGDQRSRQKPRQRRHSDVKIEHVPAANS